MSAAVQTSADRESGRRYRIGLIVPSSNITMETELPSLFQRRAQRQPERFSFHSARTRMTEVTPDQLARMNEQAGRCATELADAECHVIGYACLIATMAAGPGAHARIEGRLTEAAGGIPVVTSAGALVAGVHALGVSRVALIAPYLRPLTNLMIDYLADSDIEVVDALNLEVSDNRQVGRLDARQLPALARRLDLDRAEAVILSACVQMPSLPAIETVQRQTGLPVLTAATATAWRLAQTCGLRPDIPGAGALLSGQIISRVTG
jgi:maleate isomerase